MFGNTIVLNVGTLASPDNKTLKLVNEGNFQSEYRLTESDAVHTLKIRHTTEQKLVRGRAMERHNVLYSKDTFPTVLFPQGELLEVYAVFRVAKGNLPSIVIPLSNGVTNFVQENAEEIAGWES